MSRPDALLSAARALYGKTARVVRLDDYTEVTYLDHRGRSVHVLGGDSDGDVRGQLVHAVAERQRDLADALTDLRAHARSA